ncbi:MAG TPA: hypothetical protein PLH33_06735 [Chitinophagaceae bacterium]|nr:hypothetical protein [Chitinophagaceae bacterium]
MDIKKSLQNSYSKINIEAIATYACQNKNHFKELVEIYTGKDKRLSQMASWSLSYAVSKNSTLLQPHLKEIINQLNRKDVHDAVIRNALRILQDIEIPIKFHGTVMHTCFNFIETPSTPVAIKAFSLTILYNLSKIYTEIKPELICLIETNIQHETAAFKSRGNKILKLLKNK